jgi:hypothetical protein
MKKSKNTEIIRKHGWLCQHVSPMPWQHDEFPFSYSIGFYETYKQPEIVIIGYQGEVAYNFLHGCLQLIQNGEILCAGKRFDNDVSNGYQVEFKEIRKDLYEEHLGLAVRYYGHTNFPALVLFWPDKDNRLPWEPGYNGIEQAQELRLV